MILGNLAECAEEWCRLRLLEPPPVIELSRYDLEPLRKDEEFILIADGVRTMRLGLLI
jgi:hypothetical protein